MTLPLSAIPSLVGPGAPGAPRPARASGQAIRAFEQELARGVRAINGQLQQADRTVEAMVEGQGTNLHEAMVALERADIATRLGVRVGQKLVQAYQEVSRMQV